jgi:hypothetical protein
MSRNRRPILMTVHPKVAAAANCLPKSALLETIKAGVVPHRRVAIAHRVREL